MVHIRSSGDYAWREDLYNRIGEQLAEDDSDSNLKTSITRVLVMSRARAECEGHEILAPADVAADGDFVEVDPN